MREKKKLEDRKGGRELATSNSYSLSINYCFVLKSTFQLRSTSSSLPLGSGLILVLRPLCQKYLRPRVLQRRVENQLWSIKSVTALCLSHSGTYHSSTDVQCIFLLTTGHSSVSVSNLLILTNTTLVFRSRRNNQFTILTSNFHFSVFDFKVKKVWTMDPHLYFYWTNAPAFLPNVVGTTLSTHLSCVNILQREGHCWAERDASQQDDQSSYRYNDGQVYVSSPSFLFLRVDVERSCLKFLVFSISRAPISTHETPPQCILGTMANKRREH